MESYHPEIIETFHGQRYDHLLILNPFSSVFTLPIEKEGMNTFSQIEDSSINLNPNNYYTIKLKLNLG